MRKFNKIFKRLVTIPIAFLFIISFFSVVISLTYWVVTGNDYGRMMMAKINSFINK